MQTSNSFMFFGVVYFITRLHQQGWVAPKGWLQRNTLMHKTNPFELKNQLVFEQIQRVGRRKGSTECALPFHQHTGKFIGGFASLTPLDATHICEFA